MIVKIPNCSTTILTLVLKPLHDAYTLGSVRAVTMQSTSGASTGSPPSIIGNIIPYTPGEEEKIAGETRKIQG